MNNTITLDVKELSSFLHCSESTIRKLIRENKIPYFRIASKILFVEADIQEWINQNSIQPAFT